jgi:hypothetical protein
MTPKALLDYLDAVLDCDALRRLDQGSLHRLENLLHHWYALVGDIRRQKAAAATASQLARAAKAQAAAPAFSLQAPPSDEHALHPGAI